jgi:hypothetical protein
VNARIFVNDELRRKWTWPTLMYYLIILLELRREFASGCLWWLQSKLKPLRYKSAFGSITGVNTLKREGYLNKKYVVRISRETRHISKLAVFWALWYEFTSHQSTWRYNPEDSHLHTHCRENVKSWDISLTTISRLMLS